jgi:hypothetical protein
MYKGIQEVNFAKQTFTNFTTTTLLGPPLLTRPTLQSVAFKNTPFQNF